MLRTSSTRSGSVWSIEVTMLTSTGKNTMSATTTMRGVRPKPNQMMSSGASTTIGMVWLITTKG